MADSFPPNERIAVERWHYVLKVPAVDEHDLAYISAVHADQPILISGMNSLDPLASRLRESPLLYTDLSRIRGPQVAIEQIAEKLAVDKLVFGSLWPIQIF